MITKILVPIEGSVKNPSSTWKNYLDFHNYDENLCYPLNMAPMSHLFFCSHCVKVKPRTSLKKEILSYYCPTCLFEAPNSTAIDSDGGKCMRGCFLCFQCQANLAVMESSTPGNDQSTRYFLSCGNCNWNSKDAWGWYFPKPSGIASQLMKFVEQENIREAELKNLMSYWIETAQYFSHQQPLMKDYMSGSWSKRLSYKMKLNNATEDVKQLPTFTYKFDRWENFEKKDSNNSPEGLQYSFSHKPATITSCISNNGGKLKVMETPERTPLRCKISLRCNECDHLLYKPESRPSIIAPRIAYFGYLYLPQVSLSEFKTLNGIVNAKIIVRPPKELPDSFLVDFKIVDFGAEEVTSEWELKIKELSSNLTLEKIDIEFQDFETIEGDVLKELVATLEWRNNVDIVPFQILSKGKDGSLFKIYFALVTDNRF